MSIWLIVVMAALTYASRALALVAMPDPSPRLSRILNRIPAPLFAALAAMSLFEGGQIKDARTLVASLVAAVMTPTRSLLLVLIGGIVGYTLALVFA